MTVSPRARAFLTPSIPDLVFLGGAATLTLFAPALLLNRDGDLPRHIAVGRTMIENGALATRDFFSHTRYGEPFLAYEWLSQVFFAAAHLAGGLPLVTVAVAVLIAASYALAAAFMLRRGVDPVWTLATLSCAVLLGPEHWAARPHAFSFLGCALLLPLLTPGGRRRVLWFALLFVLWANLHPGFLFGLGVLALAAAGDLIEALVSPRERPAWLAAARYHGAAFATGLLATLVNPFGIGLHAHSLGHLGSSMVTSTTEFMPPDFQTATGRLFLSVLLLSLAFLALRKGARLEAPVLLIFLATLAMALLSRRYVTLYGLFTLPLLVSAARPAGTAAFAPLRRLARVLAEGDARARRGVWAGVIAVALTVFALAGGRAGGQQLIANGFDARRFPIQAIEFAHDAGIRGRLFNHYIWGGYIAFAWPGQPVFIDGLADFYGEEVFADYLRISGLHPGWRERMQKWGIDVVMIPPDSPLASALGDDDAWRERYRDDIAVVLERAGPEAGRS